MAPRRNTTPTPEVTPGTGTPDTGAGDAKADAIDWGTLDAPIAMPARNTFSGIKVDVIKGVPEPLRQRAESQLVINTERVKAAASSTAKRSRVDYHWDLQRVTTSDMGDQFVKLLTKYAKYRPAEGDIPHSGPNVAKGQVTARCGATGHFVKDSDGHYVAADKDAEGAIMGVRYSVRPFEQRGDTQRLPGTAA
jgi:hypothetical protein